MLQPQIASPGAILQRFLKSQKIEEASNRIRSKKPQIAASNRVFKVLGETREVVVRSFALP
ncbi:hypothetical protein MRB53_025867, partial [Persea americana]